MKKNIFIIIALAVLMLFTSCEPSVGVPEEVRKNDEAPVLSYARMGTPNTSKGLNISVEDLSVDHFEYKFTYLGHKSYDGLAVGETDGWTYIKQTPNDWKFYLEQGLWRFEAKAVYIDETSHTFDSYEGYVNKKENALSLYIDILLSSYDEHGTGSIIFDDLMLPALYADKTYFYVGYELLDKSSTVVKSGTVPMAEVKSGDGVATMEDFRVDNISAGDYSISILVYEYNTFTQQYEVKSGVVADGIKVYSGCNSTVTGTFGDDGNYLNATVRTYQASTTFNDTVKIDDNIQSSSDGTTGFYTFTCGADNPKNIRWFVDGIEQKEVEKSEWVDVYGRRYCWTCPLCHNENKHTSEPYASYGWISGRWQSGTKCSYCNYQWEQNNTSPTYEYKRTVIGQEMQYVKQSADGTETSVRFELSQMGHGNSGATTHYVECIYVDVEGHVSSSSHEVFVGSKYFANLGGSSVFTMGDGNEIKYWLLDIEPDNSLISSGFSAYSSINGQVKVDKDQGIWLSEGLWNIKSATAYDKDEVPIIKTTNPKKVYVNRQNPYINIEDAVKAETDSMGKIKISNLKMNSLKWNCNYDTGTLVPSNVITSVDIYKLDENGNDIESNEYPIHREFNGASEPIAPYDTEHTESSGGKTYKYQLFTYMLVDEDAENNEIQVKEGVYRVQINVNSGERSNYIDRYKWGIGRNDWGESNYSGKTGGYLEVIVNVSANTTQTVTGTLSCNHCIKTDTNY